MATLNRVNLLQPRTVTPGVTATPLFPAEPYLDASWILIMVRDLGTCSYVRIGNNLVQEQSLLGAGDFIIYDAPPGCVFRAGNMYCISDAGDAVIEISGVFPDQV